MMSTEVDSRVDCNKLLRQVYVEWFDNFLTIEKFAEWHGMTPEDAQSLIDLANKAMKHYAEMTKAQEHTA
jgi:hypothetical protein